MTTPEPLRPWEKVFLGVFAAVLVVFGVITEIRSANLSRRMGDLGVFLRAGWAVRMGGDDLYHVTCNNGWHYNYPPMYAILMAPFADPPAGGQPVTAVPYAWSVAFFYVFGVFCLFWAVHCLATALDPETAPWSRRWWVSRILPILPVTVALGTSLGKGQVNTLILVALCGWLAETIRGRGLHAGLYLSFAIAVKIVPAFLVLLPLYRRDIRCLAGIALGLFLALVAIPVAVFGPSKAYAHGRQFVGYVLAPGLSVGKDSSRAHELTGVNGTDSQTFTALLHNNLYPDPNQRPCQADAPVRMAHWILAALTTGVTLLTFRHRDSDANEVLFGGTLTLLMILISPVSHLHYFAFLVPLFAGLFFLHRGEEPYPSVRILVPVFLCGIIILCASLPPLKFLCDKGLAVIGALLLWVLALTYSRMGNLSKKTIETNPMQASQAA